MGKLERRAADKEIREYRIVELADERFQVTWPSDIAELSTDELNRFASSYGRDYVKFTPGRIEVSPNADSALKRCGLSLAELLARHVRCDADEVHKPSGFPDDPAGLVKSKYMLTTGEALLIQTKVREELDASPRAFNRTQVYLETEKDRFPRALYKVLQVKASEDL